MNFMADDTNPVPNTVKPDNKGSAKQELTAEQIATMKAAIESSIDDFMKSVGIKEPSNMTDPDGWRHFQKGSAEGFSGVTIENNKLIFHAVAKVMNLPSDKELILPLMRELLEINLSLRNEAKIGIKKDVIYIAMMKPVEYMTKSDVPRSIDYVMSLADDIDEKLIGKYGGTSKKR